MSSEETETTTEVVDLDDPESVRRAVRERYGSIAKFDKSDAPVSSCCAPKTSCCGAPTKSAIYQDADAMKRVDSYAENLGYDAADLASLPDGANMGLSCGNPVAIASLAPGEVVVDLGSGGGV